MNRYARWGFALTLLPIAACSTSPAPMPAPMAMAAPAPMPMAAPADSNFVMAAANTDMTEIQAAQQALEKGRSPAVKRFAQMMIDAHTGMSQRLSSIAASKGITVPTTLDAQHQQMVDMLTQTPAGARFDAAYIRSQVMGHQMAVQLVSAYAANGADPDLKAYAQQGLPEIRKHLAMARSLSGRRR